MRELAGWHEGELKRGKHCDGVPLKQLPVFFKGGSVGEGKQAELTPIRGDVDDCTTN